MQELKTFQDTQDEALQEQGQEVKLSALEAQNKAAQEKMDADFRGILQKDSAGAEDTSAVAGDESAVNETAPSAPAQNTTNFSLSAQTTPAQSATNESEPSGAKDLLKGRTTFQSTLSGMAQNDPVVKNHLEAGVAAENEKREQEQANEIQRDENGLVLAHNGQKFLTTGSNALDKKIANGELTPFQVYAWKKAMGLDISDLFYKGAELSKQGDLNLSQSIKKLSGDKDFEQIKDLNKAFENLNSIIANSNDTSGNWNWWARTWSDATGHAIFSADDENQQRINDESYLYSNYLNAMKLKSGGTASERAQMRKAINFKGLDAEQTRKKALGTYDYLMQAQNNALKVLRNKGYSDEMIFSALDENARDNFVNNRKAYEYLKTGNNVGKSFDQNEFESIWKYGEYFNERNAKNAQNGTQSGMTTYKQRQ